jgi:hypothetical protein
MITLDIDEKTKSFEFLLKDKLGNKIFAHAYYGSFDTLMALTEKSEVAATILVRDGDNFILKYEDNKFRGKGIMENLEKLASNDISIGKYIIDGLKLKTVYNKADALCLVGNSAVIACIIITPEGNVINLWRDADYRNSKEINDYTLLCYGFALKNKLILKDSDDIFSWVSVDNVISNKYVINDGGHVFVKRADLNGIPHNVYSCKKKIRIEKARILAKEYGLVF